MNCNNVIEMKLFSCKLYLASVTFLFEIRIVLFNFGINGSIKEAKYINWVFILGLKIFFFYYQMNVKNKFNVKDSKVIQYFGVFFKYIFMHVFKCYSCCNFNTFAYIFHISKRFVT